MLPTSLAHAIAQRPLSPTGGWNVQPGFDFGIEPPWLMFGGRQGPLAHGVYRQMMNAARPQLPPGLRVRAPAPPRIAAPTYATYLARSGR